MQMEEEALSQGMQWLLGAEKGREQTLSWSFWVDCGLADTLTLTR